MKSSAITLIWKDRPFRDMREKLKSQLLVSPSILEDETKYLINLIDSPGHVDFSVDVASAARLCDGAIVVVDAVEGVCIQTHAVLRTAWAESVRPVLMLNKIDRLITELKLSPTEAYFHLCRIIEQVNVIRSELLKGDLMANLVTQIDGKKNEQAESSSSSSSQSDPTAPHVFEANALDVDESLEASVLFEPGISCNVIFASAIDGWAFTTDDFASLHCKKLELPKNQLRKSLWGEYYFNPKSKKIVAEPPSSANNKPLAVALMLERLWAVYDAVVLNPDEGRVSKILGALALENLKPRDLAVKDNSLRLQAIMRAWLPLHATVLRTVARILPSPVEAQPLRLAKLFPIIKSSIVDSIEDVTSKTAPLPPLRDSMTLEERLERVRLSIERCDNSPDAECVVFVSKMFAVPKASLPAPCKLESVSSSIQTIESAWYGMNKDVISSVDLRSVQNDTFEQSMSTETSDTLDTPKQAQKHQELESADSVETLVAFARVFAGTLRPDSIVFVLGTKYSPFDPLANNSSYISKVDAPLALYTMMGRELISISKGYAGNVIGINGLSNHVLKTATLSSTPSCMSLSPMSFQTTPLVRVALEPKDPRDIGLLEHGLHLLNAADPCVEVTVADNGELQLSALGELHLDRCIKDLTTRFANCEITVSPPILSFMETIVSPGAILTQQAEHVEFGRVYGGGSLPVTWVVSPDLSGTVYHPPSGAVVTATQDKSILLSFRAVPLPTDLSAFMLKNSGSLQLLNNELKQITRNSSLSLSANSEAFIGRLKEKFSAEGKSWASDFENILCFGPKNIGPNILVFKHSPLDEEALNSVLIPTIWDLLKRSNSSSKTDSSSVAALRSAIVQGFQLATIVGPLAGEPMYGVCFVLEKVVINRFDDGNQFYVPTGALMGSVRDSCRMAFQAGSQRLVEALFACELQCRSGRGGHTHAGDQLGKLYSVLTKRRAQVLSEDVFEGTSTFIINALLPVVESFGFADDLRTSTSGAATSPQLLFSHWSVLDVDPYFKPMSEEEREEFGEMVHEGQLKNIARRFIDTVRVRKGMYVEKKIVEHAEKQRTLKK
jgi:ribosome assembly protein 1